MPSPAAQRRRTIPSGRVFRCPRRAAAPRAAPADHSFPTRTAMTKRIVCFALFACAFGAHAADWRMDFFSPMTLSLIHI